MFKKIGSMLGIRNPATFYQEEMKRKAKEESLHEQVKKLTDQLSELKNNFLNIFEKSINELIKAISKIINKK